MYVCMYVPRLDGLYIHTIHRLKTEQSSRKRNEGRDRKGKKRGREDIRSTEAGSRYVQTVLVALAETWFLVFSPCGGD